MKRHLNKLLLTLLVSYTSLAAFADNRFYINDLNLEPGTTATLEFLLENSDEFFGFQMDMQFPQGMTVQTTNGNLDITLSDRAAGKEYQLTSRRISSGHLRCGAISTQHKAFSGNSGVLLRINVNVADNFAGGNLIISNIKFINEDDQDVTLADSSAKLGVSPIQIVLDYTALDLSENAKSRLSVTFYPDYDTTDRRVTWTSSNESAVTVTDGNLSSHQAGIATITATTSNGKKATCKVTVSSVTLNSTAVSLKVGENFTLSATVLPDEMTDKTVTWDSDDESIATVDENGKITPVSIGQTAIAATCGVAFATCTVTVLPTLAESITLSQNTVDLRVGQSANLTYTVYPETTTNKNVIWTSGNTEVATVDATGKVTAVAYGIGDAVITATAEDGSGVTATCTVKVVPTPAASITITPNSTELAVGRTMSLTIHVLPETTTDKSVTWSSDKPEIASVDADGKVTAIGLGDAIITATANDGSQVTGTCTVSVVPIPAESVTLNKTTAELNVGETLSLEASVLPEDATNKTISWTSDDESVATVAADGTVTAIGRGTTSITASCGSVKATCTVTVIVPVTSINISKSELTLMKGESQTLIATIEPENANDKSVTWSSDKPEIATVDANGKVTAVALGEATITAKTTNGKTATCTVSVVPTPAESITLSQTTAQLMVGGTVSLTATVLPDDTTDKTVTWTSSDGFVATVDADGKVTAIGLGEATITATTSNGKTATCTVAVVPTPAQSVTLSQTTAELMVGGTVSLTATVQPDDTTDKTVTWTSSDESVATVDANGKITAVALGKAVIVATCGSAIAKCNVDVVPTPAASVTLSKETADLKVGGTVSLTATVLPDDATDKTVTWSSDKPEIATVDANGKITAVALGKATVTASCGEASATCTVNVIPTPVEGITLTNTNLVLKVGKATDLNAIVSPADATDQSVTWTSSDNAVATVDSEGNVTAVAAGSAVITAASVSDTGVTAQCNVTVEEEIIAVTGISLSNTELLMREGHTAELIAIVSPADATDRTVTWTSADVQTATVNSNGLVTAVKAGVTTITASASNGTKATCTVTVVPVVTAVEGITLDKSSVEMTEGETATLTATVTPDDATDRTVTWKSSDKAVATVDADGIVTAVGAGTATIYASSSNGLTAECSVTVKAKEILATGISLTNTELLMREGYTAELIAIVSPDNTTDKTVTWTSDNEEVATVDQKGTVTAIKPGTAVITATTSNGIPATCSVTVVPVVIAVEGITLDKTSVEMKEGETVTLTATVTPDDATDKSVTWKSSDKAVATVDADGIVTATGGGTATIYASSSNGLTAECRVTVTVPVTGIILTNSEMTLLKGHTHDLAAIIQPADASDQNVVWSSSDEAIVKVDQEGHVTGVEVGNAIVSATSANGIHADCQVTVVEELVAVLDISLSESEITMEVDETHTLTATLTPENVTDPTVTWRSSDLSVATVTQDGVVTAVGGGTAVIYASAHNGRTAECTVTVKAKEVVPTGISLTNTELLMREGYTAELIAIVSPDNATDKTVTWSSDNEEVATVDQKGIVTAIKPGIATVTATTSNGISASCTVTVIPVVIAVEGITLDKASLEMTEGDTATLTATVTPDDATDRTVTWKSSDKAVATVDADGIVTATGAGTATIYASSSNGLTAECTVTVKAKEIPATSVSLTNTELLMREGYTAELIAIVRPDNATDKTVTWASDNEEVATVDQKGIVTAIAPGTAVITATTSNGISASCTVTVVPVVIAVTSIEISDTEIELLEGETMPLYATVSPYDATDKTVTWKSSDKAVAIVDADGIVTAGAPGTAIIYASSSNGLTVTCSVTVMERPMTPTQLLRKGNGTTCTFVAMMGLDDEELAALGYNYGFGYTASSGERTIIAETPLRYCQTTPEIYNDPANDFWVFSYVVDGEGNASISRLRHLDGSEEICTDITVGGSTKGSGVSMVMSEDCMTLTPSGLLIRVDGTGHASIGIHTTDGIPVYSRICKGGAPEGESIDLGWLQPGSYIVTVRSEGKVISKKFILR